MGPQGKQVEFIPCGPIIQDENSRTIKRGSWALPTEEIKEHISLALKVKDTFPLERYLEVKR